MQFAIVNGKRAEPIPGGRGHCPTCDSIMIAKCGPRVLHHWAHEGRRNCDPWWENETQWHRDWKNRFPEQCREVHHRAHDGEIHRADVKTPTGICIEIQHSSMPDTERLAREDFYRDLLWIVDGRAFRERFHILHRLPGSDAPIAEDIVWFPPHPNWRGHRTGLFYRLSEIRESYPRRRRSPRPTSGQSAEWFGFTVWRSSATRFWKPTSGIGSTTGFDRGKPSLFLSENSQRIDYIGENRRKGGFEPAFRISSVFLSQ